MVIFSLFEIAAKIGIPVKWQKQKAYDSKLVTEIIFPGKDLNKTHFLNVVSSSIFLKCLIQIKLILDLRAEI